MTWTITMDWPDYRDHREEWKGHMHPRPPKDGRRQTLAFEGTFSIHTLPVVVGTGKTKQDNWLCREAARNRTVHLAGTSPNPLPSHREWPGHFWDDINITLTRDGETVSVQLTSPTVQVVDQDGERFILCIQGTRKAPDRDVTASRLSAVFCMMCGNQEAPGVVIQGARGDVVAFCDDCQNKIGGNPRETGKAVGL